MNSQRFYSGFNIISQILLLSWVISAWISWDIYHDPYGSMHSNLTEVILFFLFFNLMIAVIELFFGLQRIILKPASGIVKYANFSSFHRWRSFSVKDVTMIEYSPWQERYRVLVSNMWLVLKKPNNTMVTITFIDSIMAATKLSPQFYVLVTLILEQNPKVQLGVYLEARYKH